MSTQSIEVLEHTGDVGLRVRGNTLGDLFSLAAAGMFDIICPKCQVGSQLSRRVEARGDDLQELFVNWLSELNFWFCTEQELYSAFDVEVIGPTIVVATVRGEKVSPDRHDIRTEIKAVTYHKLNIAQKKNGWEAQVIFDI